MAGATFHDQVIKHSSKLLRSEEGAKYQARRATYWANLPAHLVALDAWRAQVSEAKSKDLVRRPEAYSAYILDHLSPQIKIDSFLVWNNEAQTRLGPRCLLGARTAVDLGYKLAPNGDDTALGLTPIENMVGPPLGLALR